MRRATFVVAMILLLGSASVPAAECAWVLWKKEEGTFRVTSGHIGPQWEPADAFQGKVLCSEARQRVWESAVSEWRGSPFSRVYERPEKSEFRVVIENQGYFTVSFTCLPDTLDPREKKE